MSQAERKRAAEQIRHMRLIERDGMYIPSKWNRGMEDYLYAFDGLSNVFNYTRRLNSGNLVLDIGAGTTKGISEISKSKLGRDLNIEATVLKRREEIAQNLGFEKTHITSAEVLRGIENNSVSLVLALHSLAYSDSPILALKRIDEVLVPGGVLKATFSPFRQDFPEMKTHDRFSAILTEIGYDVAVISKKWDIVLAVKPDSKEKASDLINGSGIAEIGMMLEGYY